MYNCTTCKTWYSVPSVCKDHCFDTHPSDLHPCAHGEPVVASAVAGVEFRTNKRNSGNKIEFWHRCKPDGRPRDSGYCYDWSLGSYGFNFKFCPDCGLLLPTASQLADMYARHQAEQEAHES